MADRSAERIGVLIIDDHRMFADSVARVLTDEDDLVVLGVATDGDEGIRLALALRPRVVLVDYQMPVRDGVAVAAEIKEHLPQTMVVMLTGAVDDRVLLAALEAGCSGFLTKDRAASDVANAVRVAAAGEALVSPRDLATVLDRLARRHQAPGSDLTEREHAILSLMSHGLANRAIADELKLSVNTVRNYVQGILVKLNAHSKLEAVATGVREGLIESPYQQ
jgi:DNA-binding NarL/FixJ family response regulator